MNYVAVTDRGYIKGDIHQGVEFVDKESTRQFTEAEALLYEDSIGHDMFDFYECKEFWYEEV